MNACFVIGHRPNRFYFQEQDMMCQKLKHRLEESIKHLYSEKNIRKVWIGGTVGIDTWAAEIVLALMNRPEYSDLELWLAIPFPEFGESFALEQKKRYQSILHECTNSVVICRSFRPDAYKKRDYFMVDQSCCGIMVYDMDKSVRNELGIVFNYTTKKRKLPVLIIHPDTADIVSE